MKRVLIIVTEEFSANGICVKAVINELIAQNFEVECITNKENSNSEQKGSRNIKYYYVKPRLAYRLLHSKKPKNKFVGKCRSSIAFLINKAKLIISIPTWPLISPLYAYRIYRLAKINHKNNPYDVIIPVYSQVDTIIAGHYLKKKFESIKYVPYFLDSLSGGYGPKIFSENKISLCIITPAGKCTCCFFNIILGIISATHRK